MTSLSLSLSLSRASLSRKRWVDFYTQDHTGRRERAHTQERERERRRARASLAPGLCVRSPERDRETERGDHQNFLSRGTVYSLLCWWCARARCVRLCARTHTHTHTHKDERERETRCVGRHGRQSLVELGRIGGIVSSAGARDDKPMRRSSNARAQRQGAHLRVCI